MRKNFTKAVAAILSVCVTMTSVSWENFIVAKSAEAEEMTEPENVTAENEIEEERTEDSTIFDLGGNRKMEVFHGADVRFRDESGELVDYDPALVEICSEESAGGLSLAGYAYENREGDSKQYLPEALSADTPVLMEKGDYRISFHPVEIPEAGIQPEENGESPVESSGNLEDKSLPEEGNAEEHAEVPEEYVPEDAEAVVFEEPGTETAGEVLPEDGAAGADDIKFQNLSVEDMETADLYGEESMQPLKAVYENEAEPYRLEYESSDIGVKENIVLEERPESNRFTFEFRLAGLTMCKDPVGGGFTFYDKDSGDIVGGIAAPYMNDATGEAYSEKIVCEMEEKEGETDAYLLTVIPDKEYLDSADRVYPVMVDPTVTWTGGSRIQDVYVCKGSPATNYYASGVTVISVGDSTAQGLYRTYMKFVDIRKDLAGKYVESATLDLYETGGGAGGEIIQAYRIKDSWKASTINWNNKPAHNTGSYYSQFKATGKAGTKRTLDITENARQMARDQFLGHGIMLRAEREGKEGFYTQFYGSRHATAARRPKLTVVYYDAPTKPASVQLNGSYFKKGSTLQVSWSGISSRALDYVQYKVVGMNDATGKETGDVIAYSASTKIGSAASATASIAGSNTWGEGCYRIWVRGVDRGGIAGEGRSWNFHIDSTAPVVGSISVSPAGYTSVKNPVLSWSSVSDKHLKEVQYQVGSAPYVLAGTGTSGSVVIPATYFPSSGTYPIHVRAVDHAGNVSAVKTLNYLVDVTCPTFGTLSSTPAAGQWTGNANPAIEFKNITELHSGMIVSGVKYCITAAGQPASAYKAAANVRFTSSANPYAGSFTMDSTDQGKPDGNYTIHVRLEDKVGNAVMKTLSYKKDRTPPTGVLTYSQAKSSLKDTVQITAACSDGTGSGVKSSSLVIKDSAGKVADTVYSNFTTSSVTRPFNTKNIKNGSYKAELTVKDYAGYTATVTDTITITNQVDAPSLTGSNKNNGTGYITWNQSVGINGLKRMEYQIEGNSGWTSVLNSGTGTGGFSFTLPAAEKAYVVKVRAVDASGLPGKEAQVECVYDKTAPAAAVSSMQQGVLKGSVTDTYLKSWSLKVRKQGDTTYKKLAEGTYPVVNDILHIVNVGSSEYETGVLYEFLLEAWDEAGNRSTAAYSYTKKDGDGTAQKREPVWFLEHPAYLQVGKNEYSLPENTNYLELKSRSSQELSSVEWYIDNQKIGALYQHTDRPWILDFHKIKAGYPEGTKHTIIVKCKDESGNVTYSVPEYKRALLEYLPVTSGSVKTLAFKEPLSGFTLESGVKTGSTGTPSYYVRFDTSAWKKVLAGKEYSVSELLPGSVTVTSMSVKAEWGSSVKGLDSFRLVGNTVEPETFSLSEMDNYVPTFLSAVSKINYKTYLTWNRAGEVDTADMEKEKAVELPEGVSYEIYRADSREKLVNMNQASIVDIKDDYYSELNINYGQEFFYRIRAVRKKENQSPEYSNFSRIISAKVVDGDEYVKLLGHKPYWEYESFENPNGIGYVEKSQGNFVYSQTDVDIANEKMPITIERTYNSQASTVSSFGLGWNHSYDLELLNINEEDKLIDRKALRDETGTIFLFEKLQDGTYASSMGKYMTLTQEEKTETIEIPARNGNEKLSREITSSYTILTKDNLEYRFNSGGQMLYAKEPNGSFLLFMYDARTGRVLRAVTDKNLTMEFSYLEGAREKADGIVEEAVEKQKTPTKAARAGLGTEASPAIKPPAEGPSRPVIEMDEISKIPVTGSGVPVGDAVNNLMLVRKIMLPDGTDIQYDYDKNNRLKKVIRSDGKTDGESVSYVYEYDGQGKLSVIHDAKGNPYTIIYQDKKVKELLYPEVNGKQESVRFTYENIENGDYAYLTTIQKGLDGKYGKGETIKSNRLGNVLYRKDLNDKEFTYTYEDNLPKISSSMVEYQELCDGKIVTKVIERKEETIYDSEQDMNPTQEISADDTKVTYEYANQENEYADDLPSRITEEWDDEIYEDEYFEYDEYGNEIWEEDLITGDTIQIEYYGQDNEFAGEEKETVEKQKVEAEDGTEGYLTTTTTHEYSYGEDGVKTETITETADGKSTVSVNKYDRMGRLIYTDDGVGNKASYTYDFMGREISVEYDENGKIYTTSNTYDENGTLLQETGRDGMKQVYTYDARNRLLQKEQVKDSDRRIWKTSYGYEWEEESEPVLIAIQKQQSPGGTVSETYTDQAGKTVKTLSGGMMLRNEYDKNGQVTVQNITSADGEEKGSVTVNLYDASGNVTATILNPGKDKATGAWMATEDSIVTSSTYDVMKHQTSVTDGEGNITEYVYENLGALKEVRQSDGAGEEHVISHKTDILEADGTTSSWIMDANGNVSKEYFDAKGNKVKSADLGDGSLAPIVTTYQYDDKENLNKEVYADGTYKTFQYDANNRMISESCFTSAGIQTLETKYAYSEQGSLLVMEDFEVENGQKHRFRYTDYTYDGLGQLTGVAEYSGSDVPGEEKLREYRMVYSYDLDGRLETVLYPVSRNSEIKGLKYVYDENSRKTEDRAIMENGREEVISSYRYTGIGNLDSETIHMGFLDGMPERVIYKKYFYDEFSRVAVISYYDSEEMTNCLEAYRYTYDKNCRILTEDKYCCYPGMSEEEQTDELCSYEYDAFGRLKKVMVRNRKTGISGESVYTYDKAGNMLSEANGDGTVFRTYNSLNQLVLSRKQKGGQTESQCAYQYDARGNLVYEEDVAQGIRTDMEYDIRNQMVKQTLSEGGEISVQQEDKYNGNGQRIQKKENGKVTNYYYQDSAVYATADENDTIVNLHLLKGENNVAASVKCQGEDAGKCFFYGKDGRRSTTAILSSDATAVQNYKYGVFGETQVGGTELFSEFCYTGSMYDSQTEKYYLNARYYEPENRRFLSQDSYRGEVKIPSSLHLYAYCAGDPVNFADVDGHKPKYITEQGADVLVDGVAMKDIRVGFYGNVGAVGCGAIAVYNVMVGYMYKGSFQDVVSEMNMSGLYDLWESRKSKNILKKIVLGVRGSWCTKWTLGFETNALTQYLKKRFRRVRKSYFLGWESIARRSTAIIVSYMKPEGGGHYVAGIRGRNGRRFKFYNQYLGEYNGRYITISQYKKYIKKNSRTPLAIVGVNGPKMWW